MKKIAFTALAFCSISFAFAQQNYVKYVNPFIGTGGHGHTYPGAVMPHGMVQLSPDTRLEGWDGCGGYHYDDHFIYGFSHTHLSGTGVPDLCDILLVPGSGTASPNNKEYGSSFNHKNEVAQPGFYSVKLDKEDIRVNLTVTPRVGYHQYIYTRANDNYILLDLKHRDEVLEASLTLEDSVTLSGFRRSKSWAQDQQTFFVIKFSKPIVKMGVWQNDQPIQISKGETITGKNIKACFYFNTDDSKTVETKVALSPVSVTGAKKNLAAELPGWDFTATKSLATTIWNKELARIDVQDTDEEKKTVFYTSLYHTAIVPTINMDADHQYRGMDNKIHTADGFDYYSVFSLWDTYRAAHPLYTIIDQKRTLDYIKTFLAMYQQGGRLPVWELLGNETDCMIGYHSVSVITDAYMKGIRDFDTQLALQAMKKSATWNHLGLPSYIKNGYVSADDEHESVSKTLEYAYDDWCIAQFAKAINKKDDYNTYIQRAQYYKNILDQNTGFMRPISNSDWIEPFDPREVNNNFTEANSWQYSFYFPQDIAGYLKLIGGAKKLEQRLDGLFTAPAQTTGRDQSDITGLIGQYAHGNEPSHHIIYLYNYTPGSHKTEKLLHRVMNDFYKNSPDGLIGNEDCGQMSAWYVLTAMGFYSLTPGAPVYVPGAPFFSKINLRLENGNHFTIVANNLNKENYYVQSAQLPLANGNNFFNYSSYIPHASIMNGGTLIFNMGNKPINFFSAHPYLTEAGNNKEGNEIIINPILHGGRPSFAGKRKIKMINRQPATGIYFTVDETMPTTNSKLYKTPFEITKNATIRAVAINKVGNQSKVQSGTYKKLPHNWGINLRTQYSKQYDGGGINALIDGIEGTADWRRGNWQGYQHHGLDALIDLNKTQEIENVSIRFLQDTRAWIVAPKKVVISVSADGKNFTTLYTGENFIPIEDLEPKVITVQAAFKKQPVRYVRIEAVQYGKLPGWHEGAGGSTHIFTDEVTIE